MSQAITARPQSRTVVGMHQFTSRRASLAQWRAKDRTLGRAAAAIGDSLPTGWVKAFTPENVPYFVNHETQETQWNDPRLDLAFAEIRDAHDGVKFAAYRTAVKLRDLQVFTKLGKVPLSAVPNAFYALNLNPDNPEEHSIGVEEMNAVLLELFSRVPNAHNYVDVVTSWMLRIYDRERTGRVDLQSFKIGISALSSSWIEEKFRYAFGVYDTNGDELITQMQLARYLKALLKIPESLSEAWSFAPTADGIQRAVQDCLNLERQKNPSNLTSQISLRVFVEWAMKEPRPLVWLPTLHRVAATENAKHESHCAICKVYPIVGFRYRCMTCMDCDVCQDCFWLGRETTKHTSAHKLKEYCFQSSTKQDVQDFGSRLKSKISSTFRRKKNQDNTGPLETVRSMPHMDSELFEPVSMRRAHRDLAAEAAPRAETEATHAAQIPIEQRELADSQRAIAMDQEQKLHLLKLIDELDLENRRMYERMAEQEQQIATLESDAFLREENELLRRQLHEQRARSQALTERITTLGAASQAAAAVHVPHLSEQYGIPVDLDFEAFPPPPPPAESESGSRVLHAHHDVSLRSAPTAVPAMASPSRPVRAPTAGPAGRGSSGPDLEDQLATLSLNLESELNNLQTSRQLIWQSESFRMYQRIIEAATFVADMLKGAVGLWEISPDAVDVISLRTRELRQSFPNIPTAGSLPSEDGSLSLQDEVAQLKAQLDRLSAMFPMDESILGRSIIGTNESEDNFGSEVDMSVASGLPSHAFDWMHLHRFPQDQIVHERRALARQLLVLKGHLEAELGMTLRGIREDDVFDTLLRKLENGVLLSRLVGAFLTAAGETGTEPHRPTNTQQLSQLQIAENFQQFLDGCRRLHVNPALLPSNTDLVGIADVLPLFGSPREYLLLHKAAKLATVVDAVIAQKPRRAQFAL